jgi:hypothetical protein
MKWTDTIERWRRLDSVAQQQIRWRRIPRQVAMSMAFEGEPVDQTWLETLHRQAHLFHAPKPGATRPEDEYRRGQKE